MTARQIRYVIAVLACAGWILLGVACGGSSAQTGGDDSRNADALLARIHRELDAAYVELGKPPLDWDSVSRVQDLAFEKLTSDAAETMSGSSWTLSVLDDRVAVYVNVEGVVREGDWSP